MKLGDIFDTCPDGSEHLTITGMTADSRKVEQGFVFAALRGVAADGRDFIPQAIEQGATAVLGHDLPTGLPVAAIEVSEPRLALAEAAARFYPRQPETIVAITGTNGKSSTVDFLRQIWAASGRKAASMGTLGAIGPGGTIDLGHTTPDPVAIHETLQTLANDGVTHAAMEASSHGLVQYRLDGVRLAAGAFTNLTQDHLDYHPTFEDYRAAKLRLFTELLPKGAPVVINADSDEKAAFEDAARAAGLEVVSVGWRGADLKISELMPKATSQKLFLSWRGEDAEIDLPLIGEFQALNSLTAAGLALALGDSFTDVARGMTALEPVKGRMEFVGETGDGAGVFVDYAHTPDGLDTLLRAARPHTAGKLVLVFGAGGDRDPYKRPLMGEVAARHADEIIVTDDNPRTEDPTGIRQAILAAANGADDIGDRGDAIMEGVRRLTAGDTLLIAGKGHETGQIVGDTILPFSDQETALKALEAAA
ncbi:MAG: UDP-N-acetylmuramoyl-L-alanyl-D-glutamate--2,6-diaminopimelate ligase [Pseudomonadota bacterium]